MDIEVERLIERGLEDQGVTLRGGNEETRLYASMNFLTFCSQSTYS